MSSISADKIVQYKNLGAAAFVALVEDIGDYEEAKKELRRRIGSNKVCISMTRQEMDTCINAIDHAMQDLFMTLMFTVLHDEFGFGRDRMVRFKKAMDDLLGTCYATDKNGHRYLTMTDCANDLNRLYDLGIDVRKVHDSEFESDKSKERSVQLESVISLLRKKGFNEAADALWEHAYSADNEVGRHRTKEQRVAAKQRRKEDKNYKAPNMNLFDPEVQVGYQVIADNILDEDGLNFAYIEHFNQRLSEYLSFILDGGSEALERLVGALEDRGVSVNGGDSD